MVTKIKIYQVRNQPINLLHNTIPFHHVVLHSYFMGPHKKEAFITIDINGQYVHLYVKTKKRPWYSLPNNIGNVVVAFIKKDDIPPFEYKKGIKNVTGELPPLDSTIHFLGLLKSV